MDVDKDAPRLSSIMSVDLKHLAEDDEGEFRGKEIRERLELGKLVESHLDLLFVIVCQHHDCDQWKKRPSATEGVHKLARAIFEPDSQSRSVVDLHKDRKTPGVDAWVGAILLRLVCDRRGPAWRNDLIMD